MLRSLRKYLVCGWVSNYIWKRPRSSSLHSRETLPVKFRNFAPFQNWRSEDEINLHFLRETLPGAPRVKFADFRAVSKLAFCKLVLLTIYQGNPLGNTQGTFSVRFQIFMPFQNWRSANEFYFNSIRETLPGAPRALSESNSGFSCRSKTGVL